MFFVLHKLRFSSNLFFLLLLVSLQLVCFNESRVTKLNKMNEFLIAFVAQVVIQQQKVEANRKNRKFVYSYIIFVFIHIRNI